MKWREQAAFTLIELLVVVAIISLLVALLLPGLGRAREQAKVITVQAELRQIVLALEMYLDDQNGKHPPTRADCTLGWDDHLLPPELVKGHYLPQPDNDQTMSAGMEDRFNPGVTYKYQSVGELYQNGQYMPDITARLWVPDGFPNRTQAGSGKWYDNPKTSPVSWVVYSQGPKFDGWAMKLAYYPVPRDTWYSPAKRSGIITQVRLKKGTYTGSFEGK